jgi:DNA-directed RNA polymerase sigma subunit (sigma70/sigma32)
MRKPMMTTTQEWQSADRMIEVVLMRLAGHTFAAIGRHFGVTQGRARQIYERSLNSRVVRWRWLERMRALNSRLESRRPERAMWSAEDFPFNPTA